jgi:hypothetical protein
MDRHIVDIEAEASELSRDAPPPTGVKPTRPGRAVVLSVRLSSDELAALTAAAEQRGIPVSTAARSLIVGGLGSAGDTGVVHDAVVRALRETLNPELLATA